MSRSKKENFYQAKGGKASSKHMKCFPQTDFTSESGAVDHQTAVPESIHGNLAKKKKKTLLFGKTAFGIHIKKV